MTTKRTFTLSRSYEHQNDLGEEYARDFLRACEMPPEHPDYRMFLRLLVRLCDNTHRSNSKRHQTGRQLRELTAGETVTPSQLATIRHIAAELERWIAFPDDSAMHAIEEAVRASAGLSKYRKGRKPLTHGPLKRELLTYILPGRSAAQVLEAFENDADDASGGSIDWNNGTTSYTHSRKTVRNAITELLKNRVPT